MVTEPRFCSRCGAPLQPGARFCASCGTAVAQAGPVASPAQPTVPYPQPQAYAPPAARATVRPRRRPRFGMILIGLLLLLLGGITALVGFAGQRLPAEVTSVRLTDSSKYEYTIEYRFVTPDGRVMVGKETRSNVLDVTTLPNVGDTIAVRYLPLLPFFSLPASSPMTGLGGIGLAVLGILLFFVGARGR